MWAGDLVPESSGVRYWVSMRDHIEYSYESGLCTLHMLISWKFISTLSHISYYHPHFIDNKEAESSTCL